MRSDFLHGQKAHFHDTNPCLGEFELKRSQLEAAELAGGGKDAFYGMRRYSVA